jgi:hypothetical protein
MQPRCDAPPEWYVIDSYSIGVLGLANVKHALTTGVKMTFREWVYRPVDIFVSGRVAGGWLSLFLALALRCFASATIDRFRLAVCWSQIERVAVW